MKTDFDMGVDKSELVMTLSYLACQEDCNEELLPIFNEFVSRVVGIQF